MSMNENHPSRKKTSGKRAASPKRAPKRPRETVGSTPFPPVKSEPLVLRELSSAQLIAQVEAGLPWEELETLQAQLALPLERVAALLGISRATLQRRKTSGRLGVAESDRLIRFARLRHRAAEVLESEEGARQWMISPQVGLGGAIPLEYAKTEVGAREVEDLLGRIEYGVYA
jgi:putative toxin-antitoxin system antitoxin component (TIGR02293 family)